MNTNFKFYLFLILIVVHISCNPSLDLNDTWEGEKMVVDAELRIGGRATVTLSRTFNPILDSNPTDKYITDANVTLHKNDTLYAILIYDNMTNSYYCDEPILDDACYFINILTTTLNTTSKTVCIPNIELNIIEDKLINENNTFSYYGHLELGELDIDFLSLFVGFSRNLRMKYKYPLYPESNVECHEENLINVQCIAENIFPFSVHTGLYNYVPSPADYFSVSIFFISKELTELREENRYKDGEFEVNGNFNSSFDNGVYGIFGYSYRNEVKYSF